LEILDDDARTGAKDTRYLFPINKKLLLEYIIYFLLKNLLSFPTLLLYVIFHKYHDHKTVKEDVIIFVKAVYLAGLLKDMRINHAHSPWAEVNAFILLIAAQLLRIPYTIEARAHDLHRETSSYALSEKLANAEFIVTNTIFNELHIKKWFLDKRDWEKLHTIYEGIDLKQFEPNSDRQNYSRLTKILSVARLIEPKGLVYLLRACKVLKKSGYLFRCEIIGGPEEPLYTSYYTMLKKLHMKLELDDSVFFLGAQPFNKVLEHYRNTDIFVLPCVVAADGTRDITPNALIEAMAMKLPVISTNMTGIPEVVEDGVSGILIPPNDENALAEAMIKLIENHDLREKLGENARKKIEERFDINKNIVKYVALFEDVGNVRIQKHG
jgi:glycosyltransferase involved in cell wall biosynthesis